MAEIAQFPWENRELCAPNSLSAVLTQIGRISKPKSFGVSFEPSLWQILSEI